MTRSRHCGLCFAVCDAAFFPKLSGVGWRLRTLRKFETVTLLCTQLIACSEGPPDDTADVPVRQTVTVGDTLVHEGRLSRTDEDFEFRPCDKNELYVVDAAFSIQDAIDQFLQSRPAVESTPIYVRFHGNEIEGTDNLPERYANVVRITELLAQSATVPVKCK